jgi:hypothetical protein
VIANDSPLVRLPSNTDSRQRFFVDGVRHAAEIADLAYHRLEATLSALAVSGDHEDARESTHYTEAFLDAWAFVDAVDRFRALVLLLPGLAGDRNQHKEYIRDAFQETRNLRNVADHIAERADYYVAHNAAALGTLSWITRVDGASAVSCAIRPGAIPASARLNMVTPAEPLPSGSSSIRLEVGKHRVCLTDAHQFLTAHVRGLELLLQQAFERQTLQPGLSDSRDMLVLVTMRVPPAS